MPHKARLHGHKKGSLVKRGRSLKIQAKKRASKRKNQELNEAQQEILKRRKLEKKAKVPYRVSQRILLVGEGNFSFARALLDILYGNPAIGDATNINDVKLYDGGDDDKKSGYMIATCYDDQETLDTKYEDASTNIAYLRRRGVDVRVGVDATQLENLELSEAEQPDIIIFNFPHTGSGEKDKAKSIGEHRHLLTKFFESSINILRPNGEVHVTLKSGEPYSSWQITQLARDTRRFTLKTGIHFFPSLYPGYQHRRTKGHNPDQIVKSSKEDDDGDEEFITGAKTYMFSLTQPKELTKPKKPAQKIRRRSRKPV